LGLGCVSRHQRCAATVHRYSGNEDTEGNSNGGGTNNQQSTKSMEMVKMTAATMMMETKGTTVVAEAP
jgi:hypothetical protein